MTLVRLDLHIHSKFSFDASITAEEIRDRCRELGLSGVAITDHNSFEAARSWAEELSDLKIIPGEEVRSRHGEIIGLFLQEEIPGGLTAEETMARIKEQGGLVCVPHPFDYIKLHRLSSTDLLRLKDSIDFLEGLNGKPRFGGANDKAMRFAREHSFLMSGGSDAHAAAHLGRVYTELPDFSGPQEFMESLKGATLHGDRYSTWSGQLGRWKARLRR